MKNRLFFFLFTFCLFTPLLAYSEAKYPADISYLVADFKFSEEDGVKICEVQHGSLSAMTGNEYLTAGNGSISPTMADFFANFPAKKWAIGIIYAPIKRALAAKGWDVEHSLNTLLKDPAFLTAAASQPADPASINSYAGMVYGDFDIARNFSYYHQNYPGILFIDAATFPYWADKFKMNALFNNRDDLKKYKADWQSYDKKYDPLLAQKIQAEMPAELYVIKPKGQTIGSGVIVVANNDLDSVLKMILDPQPNLAKHPEKNYAYWAKSIDKTFLIEKYYKSDYLSYPHPLNDIHTLMLGNETHSETTYHYDPTMRLAYIMQYDNAKITYHPLGGFWKLPHKALEETGTLNEKRISYGKPPFYSVVEPKLLNEANAQMEKAMLLLYEEMLNNYSK